MGDVGSGSLHPVAWCGVVCPLDLCLGSVSSWVLCSFLFSFLGYSRAIACCIIHDCCPSLLAVCIVSLPFPSLPPSYISIQSNPPPSCILSLSRASFI
ncbi:hypothetical protein R3P38DRAFT_2984703 [Favolaschia claudopus]|uniref:Uncharacterized protein n=1 Tax=Favolaschia claudopus TaxID=2862362 RepID=A0AAW0AVV2_9AGAR